MSVVFSLPLNTRFLARLSFYFYVGFFSWWSYYFYHMIWKIAKNISIKCRKAGKIIFLMISLCIIRRSINLYVTELAVNGWADVDEIFSVCICEFQNGYDL